MKRALFAVLVVPAAMVWVWACGSSSPQGPAKVFNLTLTPANETPPCTDAGVNATGTAKVTIPADNSSVMVDVTYSGLSSTVVAAHIHAGGAAAPGPVVLPFTGPYNSPFSKTLTAADYMVGTGGPDFPTFLTELKDGGAGYINLHTTACQAGEIRAEIQ